MPLDQLQPPRAVLPDTDRRSVDGVDAGLPDRVRAVLQQIRPAVQADGGDVEFVDILSDGTARVRFKGACIACPSSNLTLHMGIERAVKQTVPEIKRVIAVP